MNHLLGKGCHPTVGFGDGSESYGFIGAEQRVPASGGTPSTQMRQAELSDLVREWLNSLDEDQKMAVLLNKFEEMSYAEIAEVMGRSEAAIKSLLARGCMNPGRNWRPIFERGIDEGSVRSQRGVDSGFSERVMIPLSRIGEWTAACKEALGLLVFPMSCAVCDRDGLNSAFCGDCRGALIEAADIGCPRCALTVGPWARLDSGCSECRGRSLGFDAAIALGVYQGPIRQMCLWIKKESNAWLARWLVDLLVEGGSEELECAGSNLHRAGSVALEPALGTRVQPG